MSDLRRFLSNWQNLFALVIVAGCIFISIAAPWLAPPDDPETPSLFRIPEIAGKTVGSRRTPKQPGKDIPLGTVSGGLDVYYSLIWGTRPALRFGLITALSTAALGILIGAISGYFEGPVNRFILRTTDAFLTFPAIAGIFLFQYIVRPADPLAPLNGFQKILHTFHLDDPVMLSLILFSWMPYARMINANMIKLKHTEYAMAAKTVGARPLRIIMRHLLPNAIAPAIVLAARDIGGMVILEAGFTFIGIGSGLPWGVLLVAGRDWIVGPGGNPLTYWWVFLPPTLALILFSISWNLLGDGLNTILNPWSARRNHKRI